MTHPRSQNKLGNLSSGPLSSILLQVLCSYILGAMMDEKEKDTNGDISS